MNNSLPWEAAVERRTAAWTLAVLLGTILALVAAPVQGQEETSPGARIEAVAGAFDQVAQRAEGGDWQAADAAYNEAVAAEGASRPFLEQAVGEPATTAFDAVEGLLPELVGALDDEDAAAVRALVGLIQGRLATVVSGSAPAGPSEASTLLLLGWRDDVANALAAGASGDYRTMRDTATSLTESIARGSPTVARAAGEVAAMDLDRARVFAWRLRAAALDAKLEDGQAAARVLNDAFANLLADIRGAPPATPTPDPLARMHFRPYLATAEVGTRVRVPIVAEEIPDVGLGSFAIRVRWSAAALRLEEVRWEVGQGETRRGQPGQVDLALPQAPVGPRDSATIAELVFQALGNTVEPRDYLPGAEISDIEDAVGAARERVRQADVPIGANLLMAAYLDYMDGQGQPGRLYEGLAAHGLETPLATALLRALDALSQPAESDVILVSLDDVDRVLAATMASYGGDLDTTHGVPIVVTTLSATDTRGQALAGAPNIAGAVDVAGVPVVAPGDVAGGAPLVITGLPPTLAASATPPAGVGLVGEEAVSGDAAAESGSDGRRLTAPTLPLSVLVVLALAVLAGGVAVVWARGLAD